MKSKTTIGPLPQDDNRDETDSPEPTKPYVVEVEPPRWTWSTSKTMRAAPNILDIARRGGLPPTITPYDLAEVEGKFYVTASGKSTATVNRCFTLGLEKTIDDARELRNQLGRAVSASEAQALIKNLGWLEQNWIEENVTNTDRNAGEVAEEIASALFAEVAADGGQRKAAVCQKLLVLWCRRISLRNQGQGGRFAMRASRELSVIRSASRSFS